MLHPDGLGFEAGCCTSRAQSRRSARDVALGACASAGPKGAVAAKNSHAASLLSKRRWASSADARRLLNSEAASVALPTTAHTTASNLATHSPESPDHQLPTYVVGLPPVLFLALHQGSGSALTSKPARGEWQWLVGSAASAGVGGRTMSAPACKPMRRSQRRGGRLPAHHTAATTDGP